MAGSKKRGGFVLGLDLGPTSIGWAIVAEQAEKILAAGVRVFPEGVDRDKQGGEFSKNKNRRIARGMRRQIRRRARRKKLLRDALIEVGLWPVDHAEQQIVERLNPYELRRRGLYEPLAPFEIGRAFLHLNQRRGFLSNRKTDKQKENSDLLNKIGELAESITAAGHRTLGEHLAVAYAVDPNERIRDKHTRRGMLEQEFDELWRVQQGFHPELLTERVKFGARGKQTYPMKPLHVGKRSRHAEFGLHGILFYQRAMFWPATVIGRCELEKKHRRCPRGDRLAQRFRLLQEVNNLQLIEPDGEVRPLSASERATLLDYLGRYAERTFDQIRKRLKLLDGTTFNLEVGDRKKLLGMKTDALLADKKRFFGDAWYDRSEDEKNRIVRSILDDDEATILVNAQREWGCDAEMAERLANLDLGDGYASYSREAIAKLLPFLEQGQLLMSRDGSPFALASAGYLRPDQRPINVLDELPAPPDVANPLVRQALFEVRKVINAILREYGKPAAIHIELARDVKGTAEDRAFDTRRMRENEARREAAAKWIEEHSHKPTRATIEKFLLWIEQEEKCIYSGRSIGARQLLEGEVDVDHILPFPRSLDNSLMNKVLAFRKENADKGDRTPYEWLAERNPDKYEAILQRVVRLPMQVRFPKLAKFKQRECELNHFINRHLADTRYITAEVCRYLQSLGIDVVGSKGKLTADLRWQWGLDKVLRNDQLKLKNRDDHRHHAVDAIVIALTDRTRLQKLARTRGIDSKALPDPWDGFRLAVANAVTTINVSHRVRRKVAGALHEETIYGPTQTPGEYVYRKPLESLTPAMIEDIVDPGVRRLVIERLEEHGIKPGAKGGIPSAVWKEPLYMKRKPGRRTTNAAMIKKVRIKKRDQTIQPIRNGKQFVKPGSTHHVQLFETPGLKGKPNRILVSVSMLEAMRRIRNRERLYRISHPEQPEARFLMSLSRNEMVMLEHDGRVELYRYVKSAATTGQMWFQHHQAGGDSADQIGVVSKKPNTFEGKKVTVDVLGRVRRAAD